MNYLVRVFTNLNEPCIEQKQYKVPPLLPRTNERIFIESRRDIGVLNEYKVNKVYHNWPDEDGDYIVDIWAEKVEEYY